VPPGITKIGYLPLAQRHVDTGMGFERVTAIIQGTKNLIDFSGTISNYETDVFRPIFDEIEKLSGKKYSSTLPKAGGAAESDQEKIDIAFRVVADHIRALSFAIADGIPPSNEGRGYVLRRILRRAVRYGRTLGFHEPFFFMLVDIVMKTMGDVFPEVRAKQGTIEQTIRREEESFNKTLDRGIEEFDKAISDRARLQQIVEADNEARGGSAQVVFPSRVAFKLYDTYGFPLDLVQLMAREQGFVVNISDFEKRMEEQRARARAARQTESIRAEHTALGNYAPTEFVGYSEDECETTIQSIRKERAGVFAIVRKSPLYAEMGGQVGDKGTLLINERKVPILNTVKRGDSFFLKLKNGEEIPTDVPVKLEVDVARRRAIEGHHTVTHLLHWALHQVVSKDATQKGSYVGPDKLTFDFSSAALTPQQKRDVEKLVNEKIAANAPVSWTEIPYAEAKQRKDIQQFFGEKYSDKVRVLQIGGEPKKLNGYSMELCGGTHVRSTSEIGPFRIVREEAIAAGTRRIEAVAGDAARKWAEQEAARQTEKFATLARKKPDIAELPLFESNPDTGEILNQLDARAAHLEKVDADVREWQKKSSKAAEAELKSRAAQIASELAASQVGKNFCAAEVANADGKLLQTIVDALKPKFKGPIFLIGAAKGSVALAASVPKEMISKFQANKIIQGIAPIVGGKGGGRPESAQGAGKDVSKINEALAKAKELLS
jgi:alanyl-tRNA synthetase